MLDKALATVSRRTSMKLSSGVALATLAGPWARAETPRSATLSADLRDQPFDADWQFSLGDGDDFAQPAFDDQAWRRIDLPHDWSIEDRLADQSLVNAEIRDVDTAPIGQTVKAPPRAIGPFNAEFSILGDSIASEGGAQTGFTVGGMGWYRKHFRLPALVPDARVEILFDGVYMNAEVWLNGVQLGNHPYGYTPFGFDLTPHLDHTGDNVLAVRVANLGRNSRWYSGSGIYRHVRLSITGPVRFERWGVRLSTPSVSASTASVQVRTVVAGPVPGTMLVTRIKDPAGKVVAETRVPASDGQALLSVNAPRLWSPATPQLYHAECELLLAGQLVDRMVTPFGIRHVEIDAAQGLRINGEPHKLRGGCVHHDNGLLGAAALDRAEGRKVELLKARGFNAVRTSHNPPSPAFLDACDRLGMLVLEEAFDTWRVGKNVDDYNIYFDGWWRKDLAAMVGRDGNHPSVIMWSIGNEIADKHKPQGIATAKMLRDELRRLDPTRPITEAIDGVAGAPVTRPDGTPDQDATQFLDVAGYNYKLRDYERDHAKFPQRVMLGTESLPADVDAIWRLTDRSPWLIGDFVWTAMDYLGESGIGKSDTSGNPLEFSSKYPWFNANCGDIDVIGQQKPQSLARDVVWGLSPLELSVHRPLDGQIERVSMWGWRDELRSWTWPGAEGKAVNVIVYTRADRVELTLNGKIVGEKAMTDTDKSTAQFAVAYAPGTLTATAFRNGRAIGKRVLETAGPAAALRLQIDRAQVRADRGDLCYVTADILDSAGRPVPDAVHVLDVKLIGPVELAAFGNANPRGVGSFRQAVAKTWHGKALAIVRPTGERGAAAVTVSSAGLAPAMARLRIG